MKIPLSHISGYWANGETFAFSVPVPFAGKTAQLVAEFVGVYDVVERSRGMVRRAIYNGGFKGWTEWIREPRPKRVLHKL